MSAAACHGIIRQVIVYAGHGQHFFGPYAHDATRQVQMFQQLNYFRKQPWKVLPVSGENLEPVLNAFKPEESLLVFPAGESSHFEQVFTRAQTAFLAQQFMKGLRGCATCGSAYWLSQKRIFHTAQKASTLPLVPSIAAGPLCPLSTVQNGVSFYTDAIQVTDGAASCSVYVSGGGSFRLTSTSAIVVSRYLKTELIRLGKKEEEVTHWENAAIISRIGKGAILSLMYHLYTDKEEINIAQFETAFQGSGTNWKVVKEKLSPLAARLEFFSNTLSKLEAM